MPVKLEAYVYDSCGGCFSNNIPCKPCKVVLGLEEYLYSELDRLSLREACQVEVKNVLYEEQRELLSQRLCRDQTGDIPYPVLFIGSTALYGWEQIQEELVPTVLEGVVQKESDATLQVKKEDEPISWRRAETDVVVYFKMTSCRSCKEALKFLQELLKGRDDLELLIYDVEDRGNLELFQAYCGKYGADTENTSVPAVFVGDRCLEGIQEIQLFLEPYLEAGFAENTYRVK